MPPGRFDEHLRKLFRSLPEDERERIVTDILKDWEELQDFREIAEEYRQRDAARGLTFREKFKKAIYDLFMTEKGHE